MEDFAIKVEKVSKEFRLPLEKNSSIKSAVVSFYKRKKGYEIQKALNNVSLEIKKGEFFGIVGRNGSGKSTLLKLLAGIYSPTRGEVHVRGSLTPFIELGVGFNPELTGRENVFLNGALLGFNRREMQKMYKDIVEFAELEGFMDQKLKNYSSGMQVRLAFSIAIRAQSDILLIDEVLAVGDSAFQRKCFDYFEDLKKQGTTVILVSHDMDSVKRFCTRAALITRGRLDLVGSAEQIAELYEKQNASDKKILEESSPSLGAKLTEVKLLEHKVKGYEPDDKIILKLYVEAQRNLECHVGIQILKKDGQFVAGLSSMSQIGTFILKAGQKKKLKFSFKPAQFSNGSFVIDGVIYEIGQTEPIFYKSGMADFDITGVKDSWGVLNLKGKWEKF